jgi:hypothetical protein
MDRGYLRTNCLVTYGLMRYEDISGWRSVQSEEPRILYSSPKVVRRIEQRIMKWTRIVARMGEIKMNTKYRMRSLKETHLQVHLNTDWRIILK